YGHGDTAFACLCMNYNMRAPRWQARFSADGRHVFPIPASAAFFLLSSGFFPSRVFHSRGKCAIMLGHKGSVRRGLLDRPGPLVFLFGPAPLFRELCGATYREKCGWNGMRTKTDFAKEEIF